MDQPSDIKPKRSTKTVSLAEYDEFRGAVGLSDAEVAEIYGYSPSAPRGWRKEGRAPFVVAQALVHMKAARANDRRCVVIGTLRPEISHMTLHPVLQAVFETYTTGE